MISKPDSEEVSFEGLVSFDTTPPPPSVHNAPTAVAALPDSFLDEMRITREFEIPPPELPDTVPPRAPELTLVQSRVGWREVLFGLVAVVIACGFAIAVWVFVFRCFM